MSTGTVLWFGNHETPAMARVVRGLERDCEVLFETLEQKGLVAAAPTLIVIAQSRPGEVSVMTIEEIRRRWSHVRIVAVWGEWCCGQKRVDTSLGDFDSFYAHELQRDEDIAQLYGRRLLAGLELPLGTSGNDNLVAIYSPSKSFRSAIGDAMTLLNRRWLTLLPGDGVQTSGVNFVIWDPPGESHRLQAQLEEIRSRHPDSRIIALVTWPREFEIEHLRSCGVEVLAQPFPLGQLFSFFRKCGPQSMSSAA